MASLKFVYGSLRACFCVCIAVSIFHFVSLSALAENNVRMSVKPGGAERLTVGEPFILEIDLSSIDHSSGGAAWTLAAGSATRWLRLGPLLLDQQSLGDAASRSQKIEIQAIATKPGNLEVPPLALREESGTKTATALGITLQVASNLAGQSPAPAWLASPLIFGGLDLIKIVLLLAISLLGFCSLIYLWIRRRRKRQKPLSPFEEAILGLKQWEKILNDPASSETGKSFSFAISALVRRYLTIQMGQNLLDTTDRELTERLKLCSVENAEIETLQASLRAIENARYGEAKLDRNQALQILQDFRSWLETFEKQRLIRESAARENRR